MRFLLGPQKNLKYMPRDWTAADNFTENSMSCKSKPTWNFPTWALTDLKLQRSLAHKMYGYQFHCTNQELLSSGIIITHQSLATLGEPEHLLCRFCGRLIAKTTARFSHSLSVLAASCCQLFSHDVIVLSRDKKIWCGPSKKSENYCVAITS